jgi:transaldolase
VNVRRERGIALKFFVDTAELSEIAEAASWGVLGGVTTNPTLYSRIGGKLADFPEHIAAICKLTDGPVSAEVVGDYREVMVTEGRKLADIAPNVVVKLPMTTEGLAATQTLSRSGIAVNMTLVFSVPQAIMALNSGARYISPFVGRFDDIGEDGLAQLADIVEAINKADVDGLSPAFKQVEIIAASIRSVHHVTQAALMGADIATIPFSVLKKCTEHPLTTNGIEAFNKDWEKVIKE